MATKLYGDRTRDLIAFSRRDAASSIRWELEQRHRFPEGAG
ncbi:hypothetical protein ACWEQ8_12460 [Streptomyces noursei]